MAKIDAYGGPKYSSNNCRNNEEATNGMVHIIQRTWFENFCIKIIVDDVLLYETTAGQLLAYFRTVLDVLEHHNATLKLKNCKWFQDRCDFVWIDVAAGGTQPEQSKNEAFSKIERPSTWGDLCMLIGILGFYSQLLTLYKMEIRP